MMSCSVTLSTASTFQINITAENVQQVVSDLSLIVEDTEAREDQVLSNAEIISETLQAASSIVQDVVDLIDIPVSNLICC